MNKTVLVFAAALLLVAVLVIVIQVIRVPAEPVDSGTDESAVSAKVVSIEAGKDNTIFAESDNSGGAASTLFTGSNNRGDSRRALVWFNVDSNVPAGSRIIAVTLKMNVIGAAPTETENRDFSLHRLSSDWGEGASGKGGPARGRGADPRRNDATWNYRFYDGERWMQAGGDFDEKASARTSIGVVPGTVAWSSTPRLVEDVQDWADNAAANFGWAVIGPEEERGTGRRLESRESTTELRPVLELEFIPPS